MLWSAAATNIAYLRLWRRGAAEPLPTGTAQPPARHGARPGRRGFCRAIEADLGAISPGRAAAGGGHGRPWPAGGRRASFLNIMYDILTQRAYLLYSNMWVFAFFLPFSVNHVRMRTVCTDLHVSRCLGYT